MMINLDEEDTLGAINELIGRENKRAMKKLVKIELKSDKTELKIMCVCDFKIFFISLNKNNKPNKIEQVIHFLEIKKIESLTNSQLNIYTTDSKEYRILSHEIELTQLDAPPIESTIDDILVYMFLNFNEVFPSVSIKDLIENVCIEPDRRAESILGQVDELRGRKSRLILCDNYAKAYMIFADLYSVNFYQEVAWDVNIIYGKNSLSEFSLNDFDYVNPKDAFPLISALRHNKWFDGFQSEAIKMTNEMQEELIKVLTTSNCNLKSLSLIHSGLKSDFFHKMQIYLQSTSNSTSSSNLRSTSSKLATNGAFLPYLKQINLSKNPIEDRSLVLFINLYKDHSISSTITNHARLSGVHLSKCSLTSKSVNHMFATLSFPALTHLDLSYNHLKDEPNELFKFLSEPNELVELNLSSTDIDVEKLFMSLSKGGCDTKLKKLILNHNHAFSKSVNESLGKFMANFVALTQLELCNCRLSGSTVQVILAGLKSNPNLTSQQLSVNLSSNDLGSSMRQFAHEFSRINCINSLDLSDNNIDHDSDFLIDQLRSTSIRSLALSKNFSSKTKHSSRAIETLTKWLISQTTRLEQLWLVDCKLKSSLNDLISELGEFSRLRLLDISGNEIGDLGLNLLSKSLQVNRSLETLIFDRSNISLGAYSHIIESMKRNSNLKSIQIPINDVCVLYQKSPDKLVDLVKQMSELSLQRTGLLSTKQRLDLDQFFKTKMKLIDDSSSANNTANCSNGTLNTSLSSASSNSIFQSQNPNEDDSEDTAPSSVKQVLANLNESARAYINDNSVEKHFQKFNREIVDKLDDYFVDLEKELNQSLKRKYPKYYSSNNQNGLPSNRDNTDLSRLRSMINDYMSSMFVQMHNEICETTYKMSLGMAENLVAQANGNHHKVSSSQLLGGQSGSASSSKTHNPADSNSVVSAVESLGKKIVGGIKLPFVSSHNHTTPSISTSGGNTSSSPSNPTGPGSQNSSTESETSNQQPQQPSETMAVKTSSSNNNSKSKRPISAQIYESSTSTNQISSSPGASSSHQQPAKTSLGSSSSNENIIESVTGSSDDDLDAGVGETNGNGHHQVSEASAKVSWREQGGGAAPHSSNRACMLESTATPMAAPIPAPRKTKSIMKQFLGGIGAAINSNAAKTTPVANSTEPSSLKTPSVAQLSTSPSSSVSALKTPSNTNQITSPKVPRTIETISEEATLISTESSTDEVKQLQHLNKERPKRANVKRPTMKNPQSKIEVEAKVESLEEPEKTELAPKTEESQNSSQPQPHLQIPNSDDSSKMRQVSPTGMKPTLSSSGVGSSTTSGGGSQVEQPKISQNALENVKLRSTVRYKAPAPQPSASASNGSDEVSSGLAARGIANRLSLFEQQKHELQLEKEKEKSVNQFLNVRLKKTSNENAANDLAEHSEEKEPLENAKSPSLAALRTVTTSVSYSAGAAGSGVTIGKQIPPVPPNKPPRPTYNPPSNPITTTPAFGKSFTSDQSSNGGNILVKLRPVSTAINNNNNNNTNNNDNNSSNTANNSANIITNENNAPIGIKLNPFSTNNGNASSSSSSSTTTQPVSINNTNSNSSNGSNGGGSSSSSSKLASSSNDQDKRTSVREMVQMLSEESKA